MPNQSRVALASQPLLPKWANAQDGWCRAIAADVLKNGVQASDLDIERYLKRAVSTTLRQPDSAFTVATPCWRRA